MPYGVLRQYPRDMMCRAPSPPEVRLDMRELLLARVGGDVALESITPELEALLALALTPAKYDLKLAGSSEVGSMVSSETDEELASRKSSSAMSLVITDAEAVSLSCTTGDF